MFLIVAHHGPHCEANNSQDDTSRSYTSGGQTESSGRQTETSGGQTETSGGQADRLVNPKDNLFTSKLTLAVPPAGAHYNTYHSHVESHSCSRRLLVPYAHSFQVNTVLIGNYLYYYYC